MRVWSTILGISVLTGGIWSAEISRAGEAGEASEVSEAGQERDANVKIILDSHRNCSNLSFISVFSVFQIVKFKNEACTTNTGEMGTCYTESECQSAGGTPAGSCASSFGSCCLCKS